RNLAGVRLEAASKERNLAPRGFLSERIGALPLPDHDQRIGTFELRRKRRPQWPRRKDAAVAEPARRVHHQDGKILAQRRILKSAAHENDARAGDGARRGAGRAIRGYDRRSGAREQQRLTAAVGRRVPLTIDLTRTGEPAAIAAGEEERCLPGLAQPGCD